MPKKKLPTPSATVDRLEDQILTIRGHKVMVDSDLAALYAVSTKVFNQAVRRNGRRFPEDFMFRLTREEFQSLIRLRSQSVTSNRERGGRRTSPYVVTEQGVAMLSSVLNSERAIDVNIAIMRTFVRMRSVLSEHKQLWRKLENLERKYSRRRGTSGRIQHTSATHGTAESEIQTANRLRLSASRIDSDSQAAMD